MGNTPTMLKYLRESQFKPGSIIFITGASSGIGEELAYRYAVRKVKLFLAARSVEKLQKVAEKCRALGSECEYARCDVTKEVDCKLAIEECVKRYGGLDLLIANAGINAHVMFEEVEDMSVYETLMKTNFFGYLYPTKHAFAHLKKNKGQILVISSASGEVGIPLRTAYCASKFAVTGFYEALRLETQDSNVAITIVCPPSVDTPMRGNDIMKTASSSSHPTAGHEQEEKRISLDECVTNVMFAADRRARKFYFPSSLYLGTYVRPFVPWIVDEAIKKKSKL